MEPLRVIITTSDIALLTGRSIRTARRIMQEMREVYDKDVHQYITIEEFSVFSGIPLQDILEHLRRTDR